MKTEKIEIAKDAIENTVCKAIETARKQPMSLELTSFMFKLLMGGVRELPDDKKPFLYQVIEKRVQVAFTYTVSPDLIVFLMMLAQSPGTAIMYLWYLQYQSKKRGKKNFNLQDICDMFPIGFPSSEDMQKIWDAQKIESANMVDIGAAGESLFTEDELKVKAKKVVDEPSMSQES